MCYLGEALLTCIVVDALCISVMTPVEMHSGRSTGRCRGTTHSASADVPVLTTRSTSLVDLWVLKLHGRQCNMIPKQMLGKCWIQFRNRQNGESAKCSFSIIFVLLLGFYRCLSETTQSSGSPCLWIHIIFGKYGANGVRFSLSLSL